MVVFEKSLLVIVVLIFRLKSWLSFMTLRRNKVEVSMVWMHYFNKYFQHNSKAQVEQRTSTRLYGNVTPPLLE